jgi:hypothetical protein
MEDEHRSEESSPVVPPSDRPEWWEGNEEIRETLGIGGLGPYEPPRFADGTYTYEVVPELEAKYGCSIRILSLNPDRDGAWEIRVDGRTVASTERRRNENGNGLYTIDSETFVKVVEDAVVEYG